MLSIWRLPVRRTRCRENQIAPSCPVSYRRCKVPSPRLPCFPCMPTPAITFEEFALRLIDSILPFTVSVVHQICSRERVCWRGGSRSHSIEWSFISNERNISKWNGTMSVMVIIHAFKLLCQWEKISIFLRFHRFVSPATTTNPTTT